MMPKGRDFAGRPRPILCLDFDGVLHSYRSGWLGATIIPDPPVPGAAVFLQSAVHVFSVAVFSTRSHQEGGAEAIREWCLEHFGPELTEELTFPVHKPPALVTLDDRAITFTGVWPSLEQLRKFEPWHKDTR